VEKAIAPIVAASFFFFLKEKDIADSGIKAPKKIPPNNSGIYI